MITADELWPKLEADGEAEVRKKLAERAYGPYKIPLVQEWLARKERQRGDVAANHQTTREDEALKLSAEANSIAREGNLIASHSNIASWVAVGISVLALVVAIVTAVIEAKP